VPAGGGGRVQVVVQQPAGGGASSGGVVGGGQGAGVLADQVVQVVAARCGLGQQVLVVQLLQATARVLHGDPVQGGGGVGIEAGARDQAEPAEQPLLARGQIGVGQVERGRHGQVLRVHQGQPVPGRGQDGGQLGRGPGRVMPELPGEHPDRQRQVPA
jgi:hypothetical protein